MPNLGLLVLGLFDRLYSFLIRLFGENIARRLTYFAIYSTAVIGCLIVLIGSLRAMFVAFMGAISGAFAGWFALGLGIFIPSNAAIVAAQLFVAYSCTILYRLKKQGLDGLMKG